MARLAAGILLVIAMCAALPVSAARRVALLIDQQPASAGKADPTLALSETLINDFGFDVIRAGIGPGVGPSAAAAGRERDLAGILADFRARVIESDIAVLLFAGAAEHSRTATYLMPAGAKSGDGGGVNLDDLLIYMERNSQKSLVLLEAVGTGAASPDRQAGFGWLPVIPDRLLISVSQGPWSVRRSSGGSLGALLHARLERRTIGPASIVAAVRDQIYLESSGLNVLRNYGSLDAQFMLELAPSRGGTLKQVSDLAEKLCELDYRRSRPNTERKIVELFARASTAVRSRSIARCARPTRRLGKYRPRRCAS